jgi:hypothetical protein
MMPDWAKIVAGCLALMIGASAPSLLLLGLHSPIPSRGESRYERNAAAEHEHRDGEAAQHDTQNATAPLPTQQAPDQHPVTAEPKHKSEGDSGAEWWVSFWTFWLFIATTGLWFFTGLMWLATRRAVNEGQQAIAAAERTAEAANRQADHMLRSLVVMQSQAQAAKDAAEAAQRNVNLLHALERAYVFVEVEPQSLVQVGARVRWFRNHPDEGEIGPPSRPSIGYQITNPGKTPAIVTGLSVKLQLRADTDGPVWTAPNRLPRGAIVVAADGIHPAPTYPEGKEPIVFKLREQFAEPFALNDFRALARGDRIILLAGRVLYEDVFRVAHETALCWWYNFETGDFEEHGGSHYNYRT